LHLPDEAGERPAEWKERAMEALQVGTARRSRLIAAAALVGLAIAFFVLLAEVTSLSSPSDPTVQPRVESVERDPSDHPSLEDIQAKKT
jgi:hypothetical protein